MRTWKSRNRGGICPIFSVLGKIGGGHVVPKRAVIRFEERAQIGIGSLLVLLNVGERGVGEIAISEGTVPDVSSATVFTVPVVLALVCLTVSAVSSDGTLPVASDAFLS